MSKRPGSGGPRQPPRDAGRRNGSTPRRPADGKPGARPARPASGRVPKRGKTPTVVVKHAAHSGTAPSGRPQRAVPGATRPGAPSPSALARAGAARAIAAVTSGRSLDDALAGLRVPEPERPLVHALVYGVLRDLTLLDHLIARLIDRPLADRRVQALLRAGLHQLRSMQVPEHAAVAETVAAADVLYEPQARALINAVLRRYLREREALEAALPDEPTVRWSYRRWLVEAVQADWRQDAGAVLAAGNVQGPLTLRVNRRRIARDDYLKRMAHEGVDASAVAHATDAVRLVQAVPVDRIPGFARGLVSVQDASAQLAVDLVDAQPGQRVLDACAAPGGKTAHLLERCTDLDVLGLDSDGGRLPLVDQNLRRLNLRAQLVAADAAQPRRWWDGRAFDRVLLDAPCSGTGVIRRHPDIKWLRTREDVLRMAGTQLLLLNALWPTLAPGGRLVYGVCSILKAEGEAVIQQFLRATQDARAMKIAADWGEATGAGRRIAPGGDFDGFYYAVLEKP